MKFENLKKGDEITLGSYFKNDETSREALVWKVLLVREHLNKALIITKECVDVVPFNQSEGAITYEQSYIRKWLNDFLLSSFSEEEQNLMLSTEQKAVDNFRWRTKAGNSTQDKLFLLSYDEAVNSLYDYYDKDMLLPEEIVKIEAIGIDPKTNRRKVDPENDVYIFSSDEERVAVMSPYAAAKDGIASWWLRSPGGTDGYAMYVGNNGYTDVYGRITHSKFYTVRPACWISLK